MPASIYSDDAFCLRHDPREVRESRYFGHAKTHFAHLMTAAAMNLVRLLRWLADEPKTQAQRSAFAQLHPLAASQSHPEFATNISLRAVVAGLNEHIGGMFLLMEGPYCPIAFCP